jgi:hypothetical protein
MTFRILLFLLGISIAGPAASMCRELDWSAEELVKYTFERADVVFGGTYNKKIGRWLDVSVDTVWKGTVPSKISVERSSTRSGSSEVLVFAHGPDEKGMYRSMPHGMERCVEVPEYGVTLEVLNRVYGPGSPPREDNFAVTWFVSLSLMLLVGAGLWVSSVVKKGGILGLSGDD